MHNPALLDMRGRPLLSSQERCNQVWKEIAAVRNLDWESIGPVQGKTAEFFQAYEKENDNAQV